MRIEYILKAPELLPAIDIKYFEFLLDKQGQIDTVKGKANRCYRICLVKIDNKPIAIGALKQVYKSPFDYAKVPELKEKYNYEIGYLFVDKESIEKKYGSLGLGKYITKLLLNEVKDENVFATTENSNDNRMCHILESLGFISIGNSYKGRNTGKNISLMLKNKP